MKIERMGIDAYRNLEHLVLDFDDVNVIYGENAQGKTNLIEAVYLFTGAKSFRGARDSELVQFGKEQAQLQIHFVSGNRPQTAMLQIKKRRSAGKLGRQREYFYPPPRRRLQAEKQAGLGRHKMV